MKLTKQHINAARAITVAIVATVSLGACAAYRTSSQPSTRASISST